MQLFERSDGKVLKVLPGFRKSAKTRRVAVTPRGVWEGGAYIASAKTKLRRFERLVREIERLRGSLGGADVLEVGCGDGIYCLLLGSLQAVSRVRGIDLFVPMFDKGEKGAQIRNLVDQVAQEAGLNFDPRLLSNGGKVQLKVMDAREIAFPDSSFDLLISRSAMEHIMPIQSALSEMIRVVRTGGLIHHSVDPFYWLRGCHKRGLTDIPWAHARLDDVDFQRFLTSHETSEKAAKRLARIATLNRYTLRQWRDILTAGPVEVVEYREEPDDWSVSLLKEHPEVLETLLPGVQECDLVTGRIHVWLRRT